MRAAARPQACAARPLRAPRAAVAPVARRAVARFYGTQSSGQGQRRQTLAVPDNISKNNGLTNAALWVREFLRRGPVRSLKLLLKMDELRWGRLVGEDQFGNKYYENNEDYIYTRSRWVEYASDKPDPTQIPAEWHGWMHHMMDEPVAQRKDYKPPKFVTPWVPHLTGTDLAYHPHNYPLNPGYQPRERVPLDKWQPEQALAGAAAEASGDMSGLTRAPEIRPSKLQSESATKTP